MSGLSEKELQYIKNNVEKTIEHLLEGKQQLCHKVIKIVNNCINKEIFGGSRMLDDLYTTNIDPKLINTVVKKVEDSVDKITSKGSMESSHKKRKKNDTTDESKTSTLSSSHIRKMMENAQREIEERKKKLEFSQANKHSHSSRETQSSDIAELERAKRITALQEQIRSKLSGNVNLIHQIPISRPTPLILNSEGRTIDQSGNEVSVPQPIPTLKANIRAKKKEATKAHNTNNFTEESNFNAFHDDRIFAKPPIRAKRNLRFHDPGKFQLMGERLRMKAQLDKLQNEISQIARKTGISSATKLALIAPKTDVHLEDVPMMEWWDSVVLLNDMNTYVDGKISIRTSAITNLIEHPTQMRPPNESVRPAYLPVYLTQKEQKKLRRQNRREAWKEEQEKIRLGLVDPPEPKLRISNLMRVLGTEAVQDPTKIEAHVREQMAKRQKLHEETNNARKLTVEQRREKKIRRMKEDVSLGVHVAVYRVRDLNGNASKKFKVETNAKQLLMTGVVVLFRDCCIVVVEGGPKQQKKYKRLMMHRIKWDEDLVKDIDGKEVPNTCILVWEGISSKRNFGEVKFKTVLNEKSARELFQKHHVEQYWDLAYSGAVLEASEDL